MFLYLLKILVISFLLNLLWEISHSVLYKTCLKLPLKKYVFLIIRMSFADGLWISFFYIITVLIFNNLNILANYLQLFLFMLLGLVFSFIDEKISLRLKRWEYSEKMPKIFGVGLTPLLEIAITGIITFIFVFIVF